MATQIKVTTTGTQNPVVFNDLGAYSLPHPTTALDVMVDGGFTFNEIQESSDFNAAIVAGYITVTDASGNPITDSSSQNVTASSLLGTTLASNVVSSSLTSVGTLATLTVTATITGSVSGNAGTATALATARSINGVSFDGTANITVASAAGTLTGTTLASNVVSSSLTSVGTLTDLTVTNPITGSTTNNADRALSNLASVAINAALVLATAAAFDIGSTTKPWKDIWLAGTSGTPGTNQFKITGASTSGVRTITLPDASGTVALTANKLSVFAATTSAELAGVISDETGSGALVFATSPSLTTPTLGVASATTLNKVTVTAPTTGSTLTIVDGATLTASASATVSGTNTGDQTSVTGNAGTATALQTSRTINGVSFDGTANITVTAAAGTLTGTTLASNVVSSSLTSVGTLANLTVTNTITGSITGNAGTVTNGVYTTNKISALASTTSAELASVISDETGSGALVFANSPTFAGTPSLPTGTTGVTQALADASTKIATTAFVNTAVTSSKYVQIFAEMFQNPVTSDWAVNALAPASADVTNSGLIVRHFDDTAEEGVGFSLYIPAGATILTLGFMSKARTAPAGTRTVGVKLYYRKFADNTAASAWSSLVLTDISIPTNVNMQKDTQALTLGTSFSPAITADTYYQFELTRINPTAGTELTGDWDLWNMRADFT